MAAIVAGWKLGGGLALAQGFEFFGGLESSVSGAVREEEFDVFAVDAAAFRLAIGAIRPADVGTFVPGQAEPMERVEDHLLGGDDEAGAVGVLDAEDEFASALAGVEEVDEADVGGTDVRVARGGRGNADADGGLFCRGVFDHGGIPIVAGGPLPHRCS